MPKKHGGLFGKAQREIERVVNDAPVVFNALTGQGDTSSVERALHAAHHPDEPTAQSAQPVDAASQPQAVVELVAQVPAEEAKKPAEELAAEQASALETKSDESLGAQPPAYDARQDAPSPAQEAAVVVHAQFSATPLSPRSNTLLSRLETVQTKLTQALAEKTEAEAVEDAQFIVGVLADIHSLKRIVKGQQQPQSSSAAKSGAQKLG